MNIEELKKDCPMREDGVKCRPCGEACLAIGENICFGLHFAYEIGLNDGISRCAEALRTTVEQSGFINPFRRRRSE